MFLTEINGHKKILMCGDYMKQLKENTISILNNGKRESKDMNIIRLEMITFVKNNSINEFQSEQYVDALIKEENKCSIC
jgi:hypothetical protein